jgi:hypothetical protein
VQFGAPFRRLAENWRHHSLRIRGNQVIGNAGAATATRFAETLKSTLGALHAGDSLLLLYSGHGSKAPDDTSANALRLWGLSRYDVRELAGAFREVPRDAAVRFILPQCFSGAFVRSIYADPSRPRLESVTGNVCGFVSVSDDSESEGCTPGIDSGDYRDYASHFFNALVGIRQTGEPLGRKADLNGDAAVSFAEAHLDAYIHTISTDVPRTTSEEFLERWEPWYVRRAAGSLDERNPHFAAIRGLALRLGLAHGDSLPTFGELSAAAFRGRKALSGDIARLKNELDARSMDESARREDIRRAFNERHQGFLDGLSMQAIPSTPASQQAVNWLRAHSGYAQLEALQDEIVEKELQLLELRRRSAAFERLQRSLHLAIAHDALQRHASPRVKSTYAALRACEQGLLPKERAKVEPG